MINTQSGFSRILRNAGLLCLVIIFCIVCRSLLANVFREDDSAGTSFYEIAANHIIETGRLDYTADAGNVTLANGQTLHLAIPFDRPPIYPLLLAVSEILCGDFTVGVSRLQFLLWLLIILLTYVLTERLFQKRIISCAAAVLTGLYPYYLANSFVVDDQAITTVLFLALMLTALALSRTSNILYAMLLGLLVALETLTRGLSGIFIVLFVAWMFFASKNKTQAVLHALAIGVVCVTLLGMWAVYTNTLDEHPVIVAGLGHRLWEANNPYLDQCGYPDVTIDRCDISAASLGYFSAQELDHMASLSPSELDQSLLRSAVTYMLKNPVITLSHVYTKINAAWSPIYNPSIDTALQRVSPLKEVVYTTIYVFIVCFAGLGIYLARHVARRAIVFIALIFVAFTLYSAVLWAHSVHKLFLTVYIIIFATYGLIWYGERLSKSFDSSRLFKKRSLTD